MATYGIVLFYPDSPQEDELMLSHVLAQSIDFTAGFPSSQAKAETAATAETVFSIQHDGDEVGTCTFAAAGKVGTYAAAADFTVAPGETFGIVAPATADATLADISFTIVGVPTAGTVSPKPVDLTGTVKVRTVVVGKLTFTPSLIGSVSMGRTQVNGKLSVTHDVAVFNG